MDIELPVQRRHRQLERKTVIMSPWMKDAVQDPVLWQLAHMRGGGEIGSEELDKFGELLVRFRVTFFEDWLDHTPADIGVKGHVIACRRDHHAILGRE